MRVNTRENARLTFDQKVERVLQEIVDLNFELYRRITDDQAFGEAVKNLLFDHYVRSHRQADELLKRAPSKTLAFLPALDWDELLPTVAAFLNGEGGDLLIGVAPDGAAVGIERDEGFVDEDAYVRALLHGLSTALGERAAACVDARVQMVRGVLVCLVSCRRSPAPAWVRHDGDGGHDEALYVRRGAATVRLSPAEAEAYLRERFPKAAGGAQATG